MAQLRWIYFCIQSRFSQNIDHRLFQVGFRGPNDIQGAIELNNSHSSATSDACHDGFSLENQFAFYKPEDYLREGSSMQCYDFFMENQEKFEVIEEVFRVVGST